MEKKTIGSFIAALRKANGMTQKDLAERLNVSDKTVSRWKRDDGAPDLAAIPAIAEIFGVTCDELFYPQIGVKHCSMAGGGVSKNIWNCFRTAPAGTGQPLTCSTSGMGLRLK